MDINGADSIYLLLGEDMGILYYSKIEFLSFIILIPFLYIYMVLMYDENVSASAYVLIIVLPVLSSCVAAYNYEVKYRAFIGILRDQWGQTH